MIWSRQRQANMLRSMLREFYPAALLAFGDDLAGRDALAVLAVAPSPEQGRRLTLQGVAAVLRKAGRQRNHRSARSRSWPRCTPSSWPPARGGRRLRCSASALVAVISALARQVAVLQGEVEEGFGRHPDAEIYLSQPGLGEILGARVLAEFGDDPSATSTPRARKNYSGMTPITRASGNPGRARPPRPQPTTRRRPLPTGVHRTHRLTRRPRLLRRPPRPGQHPPPSPPRPGQPTRRHPPRLPAPPHHIRRNHRLAHHNKIKQWPLDKLGPWDV